MPVSLFSTLITAFSPNGLRPPLPLAGGRAFALAAFFAPFLAGGAALAAFFAGAAFFAVFLAGVAMVVSSFLLPFCAAALAGFFGPLLLGGAVAAFAALDVLGRAGTLVAFALVLAASFAAAWAVLMPSCSAGMTLRTASASSVSTSNSSGTLYPMSCAVASMSL